MAADWGLIMRRRTRPSYAILWILVGLLAIADLTAGCGGSSASLATNTAPTATTTTITSSLATATSVGQGYSVTVSVAASGGSGAPTGTATVQDGSGAFCVATLTPGSPSTGSCTLISNSAGSKTITATYNSDGNFAGSTSAGAAHLVNPLTQPAAIISPASEAFAIGNAGTFTVAATGFPTPKLTQTGALPSGLTFTDNGNGTATLTGTPAAGTSGTYSLMFTASNGVGSNATQNFSLGVNGNFGFVTNNTGGNVTVIDLSANAATGQTVSLSAGATPEGISINPVDTLFAYVANGASKDVQVFCTRVEGAICPTQFGSPTIGGAIKAASADHAHIADSTGVNPAPFSNTTDVVIASTGLFGFVVDNGAGVVYKIDTNRTSPTFNQILGSGIPIPGAARADIRSAADFAYVADGKAEVVAVNTSTGATTTIPISVAGTTSYAVTASPDGNSVYVTDPGNGQVHLVDATTAPGVYAASTLAAGSGGLLAGGTPHGIRFSPDGRFVYVADNANNVVATLDPDSVNTTTSPGTLNVVNNSISLTATVAGTGPEGVALTAGTDEVFVADKTSNTATLIDGNIASGTFRMPLLTFGSTGNFSGAFAVATMPNPLLHIADPVPDAVTGAPYDWHVIAAGGMPPYTFSISSGTLPPGLSMDASGHITGTPTASGSFSFAVVVVDPPTSPAGQTATQSLEIDTIDVTTLIPPSSFPPAQVNVFYKAVLSPNLNPPAAKRSTPLFYDINTTTPVCPSFGSGTSGLLAGIPDMAGTCTFTLKIFYGAQKGHPVLLQIPLEQQLSLEINPGTTLTTLPFGTPNPSACNQPVHFVATVTALPPGPPAFPEGTITFSGGPSCTKTFSNSNTNTLTLSCDFAFPAAGTYPITATYDNDGNFLGSMATTQQVVSCGTTQTPTTTNLTTSQNPKIVGQTITLLAKVAAQAGVPTGTVNFLLKLINSNLMLGTATVDANGMASITTDPLPVGMDTIEADYSGDSNFAASSGTFVETVNQATTTTTASASLNPVVVGQPLMLNASVTPQFTGSPTGTANFYNASAGATCSSLGTSILLASNGVASGTTSVGPLPLNSAGILTILVCYAGDTNFIGSSTTFTETVNKANTATTVSSSPNPVDVGQSVMFFTNVHAVSPSIGAPLSGTVNFTIDGVAGSPVSVSSGSFSTSSLTAGTHTVTAAYSGDSNTNPSDSTGSPFTETVNPALAIIARTPFGQLPDALLGFPYSQTPDVIGGTAPLAFSVSSSDFTNNVGNTGTACQGLSVDSSTGAITGTPAMLGTCGSTGIIVVNDAVHGPPGFANLNIPVRKRQAYVVGPGGVGPGGDDTVEVVDTGAKSFITSIDATGIGVIPAGIALTRNGHFALVNFNFTQLFPAPRSRFLTIDTTTNTAAVLGPFNFSSCLGPNSIAIGTVPIASVASISRAGGTVTVTTATPHGLAIQDLVAISGVGDGSFDGTFLISNVTATTFTYSQTAPDATSSGGTASAERAYVGCSNSEIGLIDVSPNSGNPVDITPAGLTSLGTGTSTFDGVSITPDASKVFAVDSANGQFFVVTTATNAVTGPFGLCTNPKGIAITPAGDRAYVACDAQTIAVINTATNAVTTISAGTTDNWNDVAITPDGTRVYVTAANTGDFTVIDNTRTTPAVIPATPIAISNGALQGITIPPMSPVPGGGLPVFIADSTTSPTTTSSVDIRDDSPILFPADATSSISLTAGALNPAGTGAPISIAAIPVPYLFIASSALSPVPVASTAYTSAPLAAGGGVGALTWSAIFNGTACGSLTINASTGVISGTPGAGGSGTCTINLGVIDATAQTASAQIGFVL